MRSHRLLRAWNPGRGYEPCAGTKAGAGAAVRHAMCRRSRCGGWCSVGVQGVTGAGGRLVRRLMWASAAGTQRVRRPGGAGWWEAVAALRRKVMPGVRALRRDKGRCGCGGETCYVPAQGRGGLVRGCAKNILALSPGFPIPPNLLQKLS